MRITGAFGNDGCPDEEGVFEHAAAVRNRTRKRRERIKKKRSGPGEPERVLLRNNDD
jgi:hypothetical protein